MSTTIEQSADWTAPVLLLDVDGVLSPFGNIPDWRVKQLEPLTVGGYLGEFLVDPQVVDNLARLHDENTVKIEWCTSWETEARDELGPYLGPPFTTLPVHFAETGARAGLWFKLHAASTLVAAGERAIWCEDHIGSTDTSIIDGHTNLLAICPDPTIGLMMGDIQRIEAWCAL